MRKIDDIKYKWSDKHNEIICMPSSANEKSDKRFVGIKVEKSDENNKKRIVKFFYPEAYKLSIEDDYENDDLVEINDDKKDLILNDIQLILESIYLLSKHASENDEQDEELDHNLPLKAMEYIINDYLINKRYINNQKEYKVGIYDKINWKRTLQNQPFISNTNIIYPYFVSEIKTHKDNLITEIYMYCVKQSFDYFGWFYDLQFDETIDYNQLFNPDKYLAAIDSELHKTFIEQSQERLVNMRNIISFFARKKANNQNLGYGIDKYELVFEKMLDKLFSNVTDKSIFYPQGYWKIDDKNELKTPLRPDCIMVDNNDLYIIDAKYYRYGISKNPNDLPDSSNMAKQIIYGQYNYFRNIYNHVYNIFILPYKKQNKDDQTLKYFGYASLNWNYENLDHQKIRGLFIDLNFLVNNWFKNNHEIKEEFKKIIKNH
ncbi:hypothetical protein [Mycoplasma sp. E35C]|uniref:hypothetical protein n=1 Tax=Mycoplasma sp. E35C TaxID=2801918 RepID=UPI001CA3EFBA|nr:hypothetical protein [Mycoplasma sp. E35C]QZX49471.1 hypothetical protein JJE79_01860 [Mycoplasma sp. E35C]